MSKVSYDAALTNRRYDTDGRLHILKTRISKATVNPYYGREIPNCDTLGLDSNRIYYLLRDPEELKKSCASFARVPLMFKHIAVSAEDPHQDQVAGAIGSDVEFDSPYLIADLCVWDQEAIAGIETDTVRELSSSYHYSADMTPGVFEGKPYDGVMRNIAANHVALVESGRAGSDVLAADSKLEKKMETKFGKLIYAILCATSPKLAKDAALKPLVIGLTKETFDAKTLAPQLLAMDADLAKYPKMAPMITPVLDTINVLAAMDAEPDDKQEDDEEGKEKDAKDKRKAAKDMSFDDWANDEEEEFKRKDEPDAKDRRAARDAEEDDQDREKRREYEKMAGDARRAMDGGFDDLVSKLQGKGYSKEYATKVAGKVAAEKSGDCDMGAKDAKAKDVEMEKEKKEAEDKNMKTAMDEFKKELRDAEDARREVRSVVGEVLAQDSAAGIYGFALDQMKIDHKDIKETRALRALFNLAASAAKEKPTARPAFDASGDMAEKFPNASRELRTM